jgi:IrrE N-terminal-like domain
MNVAENFAKTLSRIYSISVPVEIEKIINIYADLEYVNFPPEANHIDGVAFGLKAFGTRPKIYINKNKPRTRQLFTMAHELGHVIIPWHMGTIIDETLQDGDDSAYEKCENEADAFASELLLPREWISNILGNTISFATLKSKLNQIALESKLSYAAIGFKVISILPPNYVYIYTKDGKIISCQKSPLTSGYIKYPYKNTYIEDSDFFYQFSSQHFVIANSGDFSYYWFYVGQKFDGIIYDDDCRGHQEILKKISIDIGLSKQHIQSISGIFGFGKSRLHIKNQLSFELLYSHCLGRLESDDELYVITEHEDFKVFLYKKVQSMI